MFFLLVVVFSSSASVEGFVWLVERTPDFRRERLGPGWEERTEYWRRMSEVLRAWSGREGGGARRVDAVVEGAGPAVSSVSQKM